jgi:hypothetical protein
MRRRRGALLDSRRPGFPRTLGNAESIFPMVRIKSFNSRPQIRIGYAANVMKTSLKFTAHFALVLAVGTTALSAQSCAAAGHASNAVVLSAAGSGEALAAAGDSAKGSLRVAAGIVAVPVWLSGTAVTGSGALVAGVGAASAEAGSGLTSGGKELWDFASGDPARRPALNRLKSVPPLRKTPAKPADPSPAEALKAKL